MSSYCNLLCILQAAKDVVLAEKPVISDDSNQLDPSLLDELLSNIATLSSVYHKPPEAFVTRVKTTQKTEEEDYPEAGEQSYSDSPARVADSGASPPASSANPQHPASRQPAAPAALPDLLDLGMDNSGSAIVSVDQPASPAGYVQFVCNSTIKNVLAISLKVTNIMIKS